MVSENYIDEIASQLVAGLVQVPVSDKSENQQPEQAVEEPSQDDTAVVQQPQDEGVVEEPEPEVVDEGVPTAQPQAQAEPTQVEQPKQVGGIPPEEVEKIKADYEKRIDELLKDLEYYKLQLENLKKQYEAVKPLVENPLGYILNLFPDASKNFDIALRNVAREQAKKELANYDGYDVDEVIGQRASEIYFELKNMINQQVENVRRRIQEINEANEKFIRQISESKVRAMRKYGLNEEQFRKEVEEWFQSKGLDWELIADLRFKDEVIKKAVEKAIKEVQKVAPKQEKVPNVVPKTRGTTQVRKEDHLSDLRKFFGDI
jgi:hypothetical protein